jgi:transcriptional regulator with XRE-family HTH domain
MSKKIETARKMLLDYLRAQMEEKGITHAALAKITGFRESNISRMLSAKYPPTLDNFLILCEAVNCYLFIIDKEAGDDTAKLMRERWKRKGDSN